MAVALLHPFGPEAVAPCRQAWGAGGYLLAVQGSCCSAGGATGPVPCRADAWCYRGRRRALTWHWHPVALAAAWHGAIIEATGRHHRVQPSARRPQGGGSGGGQRYK